MKGEAKWRTNWGRTLGFDSKHMSFREEREVANI
jgi:hypothetical protein